MSVAQRMGALAEASAIPLPIPRIAGYRAAVADVPPDEVADLVAVLTEGAMHGPDAARGMAHLFGG